MQFGKKINLIKKMLKKKKEFPIIELQIKDYNNSNFYISLLYSSKIEMFKVLYIPLDVVEDNRIEEYCCYQFMKVKSATYIIDQIKEELPKYQNEKSRDTRNPNISNFSIQINIYLNKKEYTFYTTRYLPKEWKLFFEAIVMLFEHSPNIMSELATDLLSVAMNTNESIAYQASLNCDLSDTDLKNYFPALQNEKELKKGKLDFLEKINGKYHAIIEKHLIIIEYNDNRKILNIFCDNPKWVYSIYTYQVLMAIKNKKEKKFYKIKLRDSKEHKNYNFLCLGIDKKDLIIIKHNQVVKMPLNNIKDKKIEILEDKNNTFKKKLERVMES